MDWFRLSSLSIGSLSTTIVLGVITVYLLSLKQKTTDTWYLTGYLGVLFLLLLSYTLRYSLFTPLALNTGQVSNLIVFGVACLIQFAYHYGGDAHPRESRLLLIVSLTGAAVVWTVQFFRDVPATYDFRAEYFTYEYGPSIAAVTLCGYLWAIFVLLRKTVRFSRLLDPGSKRGVLKCLLKPLGRPGRSSRSFALLTLAMTVVAILYLLFQTEVISRATYALLFNAASLVIALFIVTVYVNNAAQPVTFLVKLVGIPLAVVLVTFGILASILSPVLNRTLSDRYQSEVERVFQAAAADNLVFLSREIAFVARPSAPPVYRGTVTQEMVSRVVAASGERGLLPGRGGLTPRFLYLDLYDPETFFILYEQSFQGRPLRVAFRYDEYRLSVHRFWVQLVIIVFAVTAFVLVFFPFIFDRSLLYPLRRLLGAFRQVESGNYRITLPVAAEDEVGQLSQGYNRMVESLRNAEGNFKALAENANDAILLLSQEGRIIYANGRAAETAGYSPAALRNRHFREFILPDELDGLEQRFAARMKGRSVPPYYETWILNSRGESLPVEITGARTSWHNQPADVVILRDVSERKQTEEKLRNQQQQLLRADKLASIGALVAGVAHEVNNPNQAVTLNSRFLAEGLPALFALAETQEQADDSIRVAGLSYGEFKKAAASSLEEIGQSTIRIDRIVQELKSFVRSESKGEEDSTDINQVVRTVTDMCRHLIRQSTNNFRLALAEHLPPVAADRIHLEQVMLNLVQNACQSLPDRSRALTVSTARDPAGNRVTVEVRDQGIGIPEEDIPRITDPFFTTKRESGGTGLGLSVSSRIIAECGGSLSFQSRLGEGTTAVVLLPARS
jgi:PAS domain S-box-containing protein